MKQVLDIKQMQHLQELGLELGETLLYWAREYNTQPRTANYYGKWILVKGKGQVSVGMTRWEYVPAYTLQDVLELLPIEIKPCERRFWLRIDLPDDCIYYYYEDYNLVEHRKKKISYNGMNGLIDAAYSMLCWCIENKYVKTENENMQ